jgi:hypothetical protein
MPGQFETNASIAGQIANLDSYGLPLSSVNDFVARVNALVVVGDLAKIRAGIEALKLGSVTVLDVSSIAR